MKSVQELAGRAGSGNRLALFAVPVLLLGAALSVLASRTTATAETRYAQARFDRQVSETSTALQTRFAAYEQMLRGGVALFAASRSIERDEWRAYVAGLGLDEHYPGIQGVGFAPLVKSPTLPGHVAGVHAEGFPGYRVWPEGLRDEYTPIVYLEPSTGRNLRAVGFDMSSEPVRRAAMGSARDSGRATLSGRVTLVQDDSKSRNADALLYVPVYRHGAPVVNPAERRAALLGYVYSPFRISDLIVGVFGASLDELNLGIIDGDTANPALELYRSGPAPVAARFSASVGLSLAGRPWRLQFASLPSYGAESASWAPRVLVGGLVVSLLLFAVLLSFGRSERRARALAIEMNAARSASEERYRTVVEALQEGLLLIDSTGQVLTANRAAQEQFGRSRSELVGRTLQDDWQAIHEDGSEWRQDDYPAARVLRSGRSEPEAVMGLSGPDGALRWIRISATPTATLPGDADGGVLVSMTDVTEQRKAQALTRQLEQRFRLLVESVADHGIFMLGPDGRVESWNPGAERIKGYSSDEIIGQHFSRFYAADDCLAGKPERELDTAAETGRFAEEGWRLRKDGTRFWANVVITAVRDEAGVLVGYAKVTRDLTERRQAEQRLAEAHLLQQAILDSAPYAITAFEADGTIRAFNPAAERMLWYKAEEVIGKATPALMHDPQEVILRAAELSRELGTTVEPGLEVLVHKSRFGIVEEREWRYVRKDGSRFPVNLAISALRGADDRITGFLGVAYDITERKRREEHTLHVAHHDELTGLPNRTLMNDRLGVAIERGRRQRTKVAVLLVDLDHFKRVNDSLGHPVGDQLLQKVAERILGCVRSVDTVARMGGDEFLVILPDLGDDDAYQRAAAAIIEKIAAPILVGVQELTVTASIGISVFPDDGGDINVLLKNADTAMYRAKAAGRNGYQQFSREMARAAKDRLDLENALRRALRFEELRLHYQPQVCLATGAVVGMEALLRWTDPTRGPVSPADFIPVAEDSGLIVAIGEWALRTACRDAVQIQQRTGAALKLAVNLSPRQFRQSDLLPMIERALRDSGLPAQHLELEITEGVLMAHAEETVERLRQIRALGVTIAIDDFGVGFSSLSYITRFPIDTLKIDRAFVDQLPDSACDAAVAQAIIALARSLDIRIVAEGVETVRQLEFLRARQCDFAQGFHFARAEPAAMFSAQGFHLGKAVSIEKFAAGPRSAPEPTRRFSLPAA